MQRLTECWECRRVADRAWCLNHQPATVLRCGTKPDPKCHRRSSTPRGTCRRPPPHPRATRVDHRVSSGSRDLRVSTDRKDRLPPRQRATEGRRPPWSQLRHPMRKWLGWGRYPTTTASSLHLPGQGRSPKQPPSSNSSAPEARVQCTPVANRGSRSRDPRSQCCSCLQTRGMRGRLQGCYTGVA